MGMKKLGCVLGTQTEELMVKAKRPLGHIYIFTMQNVRHCVGHIWWLIKRMNSPFLSGKETLNELCRVVAALVKDCSSQQCPHAVLSSPHFTGIS